MNLTGKTVNFLGDSITQGVGVKDMSARYDNRLLKMLALGKVNNYGISGTRFAHQKKPSADPSFDLTFCGRALLMDKTADFTVVYGGVNDYLHGDADIGALGDNTPATFYGAAEYLTAFLERQYAGRVMLLTPAKTCFHTIRYDLPSTEATKGPDALPLQCYVDIIKAAAARHGIPVLDLYNDFIYDPLARPELIDDITADGLHFNDKGHGLLAEKVAEFIARL